MNAEWPRARLAEVLRLRAPDVRVSAGKEYQFAGVKSFGGGVFRSVIRSGGSFAYKELITLRENDLVYPKLMAWEGAVGVVPVECEGLVVSPEFCVFEIDQSRAMPRWLDLYFRQPTVWPQLAGGSAGTNVRRRRIYPQEFLAIDVPLPPIEKQRLRVAHLQQLDIQIEEARVLRRRGNEEVQSLVASHLNGLFGDPYEHNQGKLPLGCFLRLEEAVDDVADGPHVTPLYVDDGVPFITVLNITSGRVRFAEHKFVTEEDHRRFQQRAKAEKGDVLISKDGTIGIPCYVDTDREFSFFVSVALVKPRPGVLDGKFLTWALRTPYLQDRMVSRSRGDMIRHLVLREIRDLIIPVPSLSKQHEIVATLDSIQESLVALHQAQAEVTAELGALVTATLAQAFLPQGSANSVSL